MAWLESLFSEKSNRKYILGTHISAGVSVYQGKERNKAEMEWDPEWNSKYFNLLMNYQNKLLLEVGGH